MKTNSLLFLLFSFSINFGSEPSQQKVAALKGALLATERPATPVNEGGFVGLQKPVGTKPQSKKLILQNGSVQKNTCSLL